ncbi:phage terminase small subunit [Streptomyces sp. NPDC003016]
MTAPRGRWRRPGETPRRAAWRRAARRHCGPCVHRPAQEVTSHARTCAQAVRPAPKARHRRPRDREGGGGQGPGRPRASGDRHPIAKRWFQSLKDFGQSRFHASPDRLTAVYAAEATSRNLASTAFSTQLFQPAMSAMADPDRAEGPAPVPRGGGWPGPSRIAAYADARPGMPRTGVHGRRGHPGDAYAPVPSLWRASSVRRFTVHSSMDTAPSDL